MVRKPARETRSNQRDEHVVVATYNVRALAVEGRDGYGRDECVLAKVQQLVCDFVGLQETRRQGETTFYAAGYRVFCREQHEESRARKGLHGVSLAVKESICCTRAPLRGRLTPPATLARGRIQLNVKGAERIGP